MNWSNVAHALADCGISIESSATPRSVGGGDISAAWKIRTKNGFLFLKTGDTSSFGMFDAEACGLRELDAAGAVRVPKVIAVAEYDDIAVLALEWLELNTPSTSAAHLFGQQLATLHRRTQEQYGWTRDNLIGLTPQSNKHADNWLDFYREQRLEFQLRLAADNGFGGELQSDGQLLLQKLDRYFDGYVPDASLLHGDLWGGNWSVVNGQPVVFDPAVYYGDRETDIAMTRLFGGFDSEFYRAYSNSWPLNEGFERRVGLYQLYHVLNHLNLFGGSYLARALALLKALSRP